MDGEKCNCYFHPEEVFVGVCPSCLYERLFLLASKPKLRRNPKQQKHINNSNNKPLLIILPRVLFRGFRARNHQKSQGYHTHASSPPPPPQLQDQDQDQDQEQEQDDSFISIRFEKNGVCAWDKSNNKVASSHKVSMEHSNISSCKHKEAYSNTRVVEHAKPQASLRWRKRIGQLFQLARWRRSYKVNSKLEGVKPKVRNY